MKITVFRIEYRTAIYDRPIDARPRDKAERVESRPGFPDRTRLGASAISNAVVAAENQESAIASLPKPADASHEIEVLSLSVVIRNVELAGTVKSSVVKPTSVDLRSAESFNRYPGPERRSNSKAFDPDFKGQERREPGV